MQSKKNIRKRNIDDFTIIYKKVSPSSQSTQLSVKWAFPQDSDSTENVSNTPLERQERSERTEKSSEKQRAKK